MKIKENKNYEIADKLIEGTIELIMDETKKKMAEIGNLVEKVRESPSNLNAQQQLHFVFLIKGIIAQNSVIIQSEIEWLIRSKVDSLDVLKIMRLANEFSIPFMLKN